MIACSRAGASRWVWRTFDKPFSKLDALMPLECHVSDEVHILCDASDTRVTIRGREMEVQVLDHVEVGLELWSTIFTAPFPISREQVTRLFDYWGLTMPVLHHARFTLMQFLTHVVSATNGLRLIGVTKIYRRLVVDGCLIERATLVAAGQRVETLSLEARDYAPMRRLLSAYRLDRYHNVSDITCLKRLTGMRQRADLAATA